MNRLLVIVAIVVLITGLGAAKGVSELGSGHGKEVTEAVSSTQHDEFDSEEKMQEGIEKDQVKRGMVIALVATGTWDDLEMERAYAMNKAELIDSIASEADISKRSARKGRNPQTGKEIKIPARDEDGGDGAMVTAPIEVSELAMEGKVKFFNEEKGYAIIKDNENGEEYFVHVTGLIDEIRDEDDVSFELREGRKGMNAVDVRRTD